MYLLLACPNLEGRFPTLDATRIPVSKSNSRRLGPSCAISKFRMARPTNFKLSIWMNWRTTTRINHTRHGLRSKVTWSVWAVLAQWIINRKRIVVVSPKFALGTLTKYQDPYDRQSRWPPRSKVTSSVRLISASSYFGKQNAIPVSLEAGGDIQCRPNPAATLLVTSQSCTCSTGRGSEPYVNRNV